MNENNNGPMETLKEELLMTVKNWWIFIILGILAIGVGIWMLFNAGMAYSALSLFFSISFLISGVSTCYVAIANRKTIPAWGWSLFSGIMILILGVILVVSPGMSEGTLVYYVAFGIMFGGFNTVAMAFVLKKTGVSGWGWNLALGVIVVIMAMMLMAHPILAILTIVMWSGIGFISMGISFCGIGYRLSKAKSQLK